MPVAAHVRVGVGIQECNDRDDGRITGRHSATWIRNAVRLSDRPGKDAMLNQIIGMRDRAAAGLGIFAQCSYGTSRNKGDSNG